MSDFRYIFLSGFSNYRNISLFAKTADRLAKFCFLTKRNTMTLNRAAYDVIVIGAGIEGSSVAYNLAKRGQKTLLIEQFPLPHSRGSSHGQSRITRYAYDDDFYVRMMVDAFPMWTQLEKESNTNLFINCGMLSLHFNNSADLGKITNALRAFQVPHEVLTSAEVRRRFPAIKDGGDYSAVWDPRGGLLKADKCLRAFQDVFQQLGGVIRDGEPVTKITPGDAVAVTTPKGQYTAHNVVVAAGPWSEKICTSLDLKVFLKPIRALVLYWKIDEDFVQSYGPDSLPCFADSRTPDDIHMYGLPCLEYPGLVKICLNPDVVIDPDDRDKMEDDSQMTEEVKKEVASTFGHLDSAPSIREYCIYTNTPDKHPYIDRHPKYPNIVIAAGFSGHGFKLAPAVGKAVTELVLRDPPTYNMQPFRMNRFTAQSSL
ncbi:hypothetical protein Btru_001478 [Bulinus truncatus]|nr:hypothetical protein Btru_001478 [Bulinus truncatus]